MSVYFREDNWILLNCVYVVKKIKRNQILIKWLTFTLGCLTETTELLPTKQLEFFFFLRKRCTKPEYFLHFIHLHSISSLKSYKSYSFKFTKLLQRFYWAPLYLCYSCQQPFNLLSLIFPQCYNPRLSHGAAFSFLATTYLSAVPYFHLPVFAIHNISVSNAQLCPTASILLQYLSCLSGLYRAVSVFKFVFLSPNLFPRLLLLLCPPPSKSLLLS